MEQTKYDVFISYSRKDYVKNDEIIPNNPISAITELFDNNGISYWIDKKGIYSGYPFAEVIADAIANSKMLVFISSIHSNESQYTPGEILEALDRKMLVIPVLVDECPYNKRFRIAIRPFDYINISAQPNTALPELLRTVREEKRRIEKIEADAIKEQQVSAVKVEIKEKVKNYHSLTGQQDYILKELYAKNKFIGNVIKKCPVCEKNVEIQAPFCGQCGWQFPTLFSLDGSESSICDEQQLAIARTNWRGLNRVVELQNENRRLEDLRKELEDARKECETKMCYQEESLRDLSDKCNRQNELINKKDSELVSLQEDVKSLSTQLHLCKHQLVQKEDDFQKEIDAYKLLEDKYNQLINSSKDTPTTNSIVKKKEELLPNSKPNIPSKKVKAIKSLGEAFSIIETCCKTQPIQDNYDFNRAKLSLNELKKILVKKYNLYVSKNAILACKNVGELKVLLYNRSDKSA